MQAGSGDYSRPLGATTMMKTLKLPSRFGRKRGTSGRKAGRTQSLRDSAPSASIDWQKAALVVVTIAVLSVLMSVHLLRDKISLHVGEVSPREVRAGRSVIYVNSVTTAQAQQAARLATRPVYDPDDTAVYGASHTVQQIFDRIEQERQHTIRPASGRTPAARADARLQALAALGSELGNTFSKGQLRALLTLSPDAFQKLRDTTTHLISDAMEREIRDQSEIGKPSSDSRHARMEVTDSARQALGSEDAALIVHAIAGRALRPNLLLNRRKTELAQDAAMRDVKPDYRRISRGDLIISEGERVTQEHLDKFQALGLLDPRLELQTGVAICVLAASMVLLVALAIRKT